MDILTTRQFCESLAIFLGFASDEYHLGFSEQLFARKIIPFLLAKAFHEILGVKSTGPSIVTKGLFSMCNNREFSMNRGKNL